MSRRRHRTTRAIAGALFALLFAASSTLAAVTYSYTSTWSQTTSTLYGTARWYSGHHMNIQLDASASVNNTYHIAVWRNDCVVICWKTIVTGAGNCPYNGFCGLNWNFAIDPTKQYGFLFTKEADVNVHSNNVQMWSTEP